MRLTGIIDYSMGNFLCIRGYAPFIDLSNMSKPAPEIQRDLIRDHKEEMQRFLSGGTFTFFPEVILCADLKQNDNNKDKINMIRESVQDRKAIKNVKVSGYTISSKIHERKKQDTDLAFDRVQSVFIDFDINDDTKMLRIDGNHRLSAVNEESSYEIKNMVTPYCLLIFNNAADTDKFSRALFHNINSKQIPLKAEENLKVILEGDIAFTDETIRSDPSFGNHYFLARKTLRTLDLRKYILISALISDYQYTYFVELYDLLIKQNLLPLEPNETISLIIRELAEINEALQKAAIQTQSKNIAVIGALSYYKLQDKEKYQQFLIWIKRNDIAEALAIHIEDLIDIYDKVYENTSRNVFVSMCFDEKTKDTYDAIQDVCNRIDRENHVKINLIKIDEHKDGYSDEIYKRIIDGISRSALVIADLSFGNLNVHHEIGYAQGHDKKVLLLYHEREGGDSKKEIGSNISMHDQIRFKWHTDLKSILLRKLKQFFDID